MRWCDQYCAHQHKMVEEASHRRETNTVHGGLRGATISVSSRGQEEKKQKTNNKQVDG